MHVSRLRVNKLLSRANPRKADEPRGFHSRVSLGELPWTALGTSGKNFSHPRVHPTPLGCTACPAIVEGNEPAQAGGESASSCVLL